MDIELEDGIGFDLLEIFGGKVEVKIIFIMVLDYFVVKVFWFVVVDYLFKLVDLEELEEVV